MSDLRHLINTVALAAAHQKAQLGRAGPGKVVESKILSDRVIQPKLVSSKIRQNNRKGDRRNDKGEGKK